MLENGFKNTLFQSAAIELAYPKCHSEDHNTSICKYVGVLC